MSIASMISLSGSRLKQKTHVTAVAASADVPHDRVVEPTPKKEVQGVPSSTVAKVTAFIPSEIIGIYIAAIGLLAPSTFEFKWWIYGSTAALMIFYMIFCYFLEKKKEPSTRLKRNFIFLTILAEVAFATWAAALPDSAFLQMGQYATKVAAALIIVLAVFIPMIASILDLVPVQD